MNRKLRISFIILLVGVFLAVAAWLSDIGFGERRGGGGEGPGVPSTMPGGREIEGVQGEAALGVPDVGEFFPLQEDGTLIPSHFADIPSPSYMHPTDEEILASALSRMAQSGHTPAAGLPNAPGGGMARPPLSPEGFAPDPTILAGDPGGPRLTFEGDPPLGVLVPIPPVPLIMTPPTLGDIDPFPPIRPENPPANPVPEPGTFLLIAIGLLAGAICRCRTRRLKA